MGPSMTAEKTCFRCGTAKPRTEFYRHRQMADGLLGKFKDCTKRDVREHRAANIDRFRAYEQQRASPPHRVEARRAYSQTEQGKAAHGRAHQRYRARCPER